MDHLPVGQLIEYRTEAAQGPGLAEGQWQHELALDGDRFFLDTVSDQMVLQVGMHISVASGEAGNQSDGVAGRGWRRRA